MAVRAAEPARRRSRGRSVVVGVLTTVVVTGGGAGYVNVYRAVGSTLRVGPHDSLTITGVDPSTGSAFVSTSLKNRSVVPITITGVRGIVGSSDWRFDEVRTGTMHDPSTRMADVLAGTQPFLKATLIPGERVDAILFFRVAPCGSSRGLDGRVDGDFAYEVSYSMLGVDRSQLFQDEGASFSSLAGLDCAPAR
jgi:hypothetical protein